MQQGHYTWQVIIVEVTQSVNVASGSLVKWKQTLNAKMSVKCKRVCQVAK